MDDDSIGAYALCSIRPSAADGPKDNANCLFIDEMFINDTALTRRAKVELHNCIGKYAIEHGYSLVLTLDALQGGMRKYYQNIGKAVHITIDTLRLISDNLDEDFFFLAFLTDGKNSFDEKSFKTVYPLTVLYFHYH